MKKAATALWCAALFLLALFAPSAGATLILFNFNSLADGASNTTVNTYMQGVLNTALPGSTVSVKGAKGEKNYTGDGHVVGPVNGSNVATPLTLGNTDGGVQHALPWDTYLINKTTTDRITMVFSFRIHRVSFDYEIFPDGTCPNGGANGCPNPSDSDWPDFKFRAGVAPGTSLIFEIDGLDPEDLTNALVYRESPVSDQGVAGYEKSPQLLAVSGDWFFPSGVNQLEFVDWPRHIGIDNLRITIPEPSSLLLLLLGLAGLMARRRTAVT